MYIAALLSDTEIMFLSIPWMDENKYVLSDWNKGIMKAYLLRDIGLLFISALFSFTKWQYPRKYSMV